MDGIILTVVAAAALGLGAWILKRGREGSTASAKQARLLDQAMADLIEVEQQREYYAAMEPMLRRRVARLQKLQQAALKVARDKRHDQAWFIQKTKTTTTEG